MPSLLRQLFDTMPLSGVRGSLKSAHGPRGIEDARADYVADYISCLDTTEALGLEFTCGSPSKEIRNGPERFVPLWSWEQDGLNAFANLACRVRDDHFKQYLVLKRVAWGARQGEGLEPAIDVQLAGETTRLPLTEAYHLLSFSVEGGYNPQKLDPLYPLEAVHDPSVVHAFVYDVVPFPRRMMALGDPAHPQAEEVEALRSLCRQVFPLHNENVQLGSMRDEVFIDNLWPEPIDIDNRIVQLREIASLQARPIRILVAVCLTTCREDWHFTPGAEAGMARLYPQLFVKSHGALDKIVATMHLDRPAQTTVLDPPAATCGCAEMTQPMASLLVSDANSVMETMHGDLPFYNDVQPYWSNLFAYALPDGFAATKGAVLNVVRNDRMEPRTSLGMVRRYPVRHYGGILSPFDISQNSPDKPSTVIARVARQGPFDNVHLAPRMAMKLAGRPKWNAIVDQQSHAIDPARWGTEEVVMAPICAHDCFHMHWRWSDQSPGWWAWGWSEKEPYAVPGAVMIPHNQELDMQMRSERQIAYHSRAFNVQPNGITVFCHHGTAYALTTGALVAFARRGVQENTYPTGAFSDDEGKFLRPASSWAAYYWTLRWDVVVEGGTLAPRERAQIDDLDGLTKL